MADSVVHFEIPFDDKARATTFYREVFGWDLQSWEGDYIMASTGPSGDAGPTDPGYIGGGMLQRQEPVTGTVLVIEVDDIAGALARVEEGGGSTVRPGEPVGEMGFAAYFTDPEGNVMGLWQSAGTAQ